MRSVVGTPTDYSQKKHWLALPDHPDQAVDLIYLYPSSCHDKRAGVICPVDNRSMARSAKRNLTQQDADDVGVVVSWNTEGPANKGHSSLVVSPGAVSINPLNWRTDDTPAPAELNLGTFMPYLLLPGVRRIRVKADAVLDLERGTVMVTEPRLAKCAITVIPGFKKLESVFGPASYHGCDYSFFYLNIRRNARRRYRAWLAKKAK